MTQSVQTPREWNFREEQKEAFEQILSIFKQKGIKYILVQAPITPARYHSYQNNDEVDAYFRSNGDYYNFNEIIQIPPDYFYDEHHLNQRGVNLFNNELIRILSQDDKLKYPI